jgi:glycosyltransferase involved in cell wall biosynthesis
MIVVIDVAGDRQRAISSLLSRGIRPAEIVGRDQLRPGELVATLRRIRQSHPEACYIFCKHFQTQFNRFPLKIAAALSGVKTIHFCDDQVIGPGETSSRVVLRDVPVFLWHCLYALIVVLGFGAAYLLLRVLVLLRDPPVAAKLPARRLCYIKTDFWHDLKAGGSVTHTREFVNAGCDLGYNVAIFSCDALVHYGLKPKVAVIEPAPSLYDFPILISQMEYNLRFPLAVWRRLRGQVIDGIYQRNSSNNFSGIFLSVLLRAPFVLEFNTPLAWAAKHWQGARKVTLRSMCEKLNLQGAYRVAVVSDELRKDLVSGGVDEAKILVNPNGVDSARFGPHVDASIVRGGLPEGKLLVGFIGIFAQWHGVLTLMRSVKHVVAACPSTHFVIIGDGNLKPQMLEILCRDGVADWATFVGLVSHDLAPAYLNACDILVSPHEDMADGSVFFGSPTKIFEYMATGKGIVASNVGQLGELLKNEHDALLTEQKNDLELAAAIIRLLRDAALRQRLGEAARLKARSNFTWKANFSRAVDWKQTGQMQHSPSKRRSGLVTGDYAR